MVSQQNPNNSARGPDLKLYVRDVRDSLRKKYPISVKSWATVKDVKGAIQQLTKIPSSAQRLYFGPLLTSGRELPNHRTLHDAGIYRSGETLLLDIKGAVAPFGSSAFSSLSSLRPAASSDVCISSSMMDSTPKPLRALVQEARRAFALGLKPEFVLDGSGGTYFLHDAHKNKIAVFKPSDEEPYAPANPRGYLPIGGPGEEQSLRKGVAPGEACIREVAAFLLDHDGVCSVPMTTLAEARHSAFNNNGSRMTVANGGASIGSHSISATGGPEQQHTNPKKVGSLQEFVRCDGTTMDDISPSLVSVEEVQKIALLDIRILNADRNAANLLVRRRQDDSLELIPIDHGFCLRSVSDVSWMDWCWLDWPQLKQPVCDRLKKYISQLDIEEDAQLLSERLNICQEAIDYFRASSSLLKAGVNAGLTLYDIAILCCRNDNLAEVPSMLEKLLDMASDLAYIAMENDRWHHTAASRALVEQLAPKLQRRSSVANCLGSKEWISEAASNSNFMRLAKSAPVSGLISDSSLLEVESAPPGITQSSASSESSVEAIDAQDEAEEKEECEEWAASVILNVSVDQLGASTGRPLRSDSISSDGSIDSDHKGFWHVRPTFSPVASEDGSDGWESALSDRDEAPCEWETVDRNGNRMGLKMSSVTFADDVVVDEEVHSPRAGGRSKWSSVRRPSMTNPIRGMSMLNSKRPSTMSFSECWTTDDTVPAIPPRLQRTESNISRSKSYSALSAVSGTGVKKEAVANQERVSEEHDLFRNYFHNFIDLVITRETTAALHMKQQV